MIFTPEETRYILQKNVTDQAFGFGFWSHPTPPSYHPIRGSSIETFQKCLANGSYTSEDLVRTFLVRIAEVNDRTHAVVEINPDALGIARALDREREVSGPKSLLHGIPILVKDSISAHGMNNTAGSYCLAGAKTKNEASMTVRLRQARAIILEKSNMSQWDNGRSSADNASNGWSSWGGQAYGVYTLQQDLCRSSSGSATAMAMGLAVATIGVETVGSITYPAMESNIVSIKPTAEPVAKDNVIVAKSRRAVGPMTSTIKDTAILLTFMAGKSKLDTVTKLVPFKKMPDYAKSCNRNALRNARIGIPRNGLNNPIGVNINMAAIMKAFGDAALLMQKNGATIVENANYPAYDDVYSKAPQAIYGPSEYGLDIAKFFKELSINPKNIHSIKDMIECTKPNPLEEYPSHNIAVFENVEKALRFNSPEVAAASKQMKYLGAEGGIDGALEAVTADALILPSVICSDIPGFAGHLTITVPMGFLPPGTPVTKKSEGRSDR
ncbi:amidase signature enzyme [Mytilinidion resinicola]|uniref:Amidase signature enzyme n=1 Tax=Mytilinidion resinicola TaxID=574789 RepID=A0A6A6Y5R6_9PEZI|nr:amidase signature enzyme [Mytilinidion resinicola]KAF2803868.1 amidase signature enzyme [Mytilinidion resinicola]